MNKYGKSGIAVVIIIAILGLGLGTYSMCAPVKKDYDLYYFSSKT